MKWMLTIILAVLSGTLTQAADWNQFRGPNGDGKYKGPPVPRKWSKSENITWRVELPSPGNSSPIVFRDRVFLSTASKDGKVRGLACFAREDGKQLWEKTVRFDGEEPTHSTNYYGSATPAADGERVVVWHSSAGLHCYDHEGKPLWSRDLGKFIHVWGYAASPVIHENRVLLLTGPGERTFVTALDKYSGETIWQTDEPGGHSGLEKKNPKDERPPWIGSWSTPAIANVDGADQILVSVPHHVKAYDPKTGRVLWQCDGLTDLVYTSVTVSGDIGVALAGFHGKAIGFKLGGSGNVTEPNRLWHHMDAAPQRIGSGVIIDGKLYLVNEPGIAQCLDIKTGKEVWKDRLPGGPVWGSVVADGKTLFVTNQRGDTVVFAANPDKLEVHEINRLGEGSNSTPALDSAQVFIRTFKGLYCIGKENLE